MFINDSLSRFRLNVQPGSLSARYFDVKWCAALARFAKARTPVGPSGTRSALFSLI
ncbi:hypothetical protein PAMC26510_22220 [Caballeronia sordidicola]|uniref:Uncharacterized protein n=1 Tax=Caballeronia sordidicola TaxID=196367 RepID=A0A242MLC1_CABSO|nr:hypothetical protein PAMC26510_22220 [Caballeronia sordidicola]